MCRSNMEKLAGRREAVALENIGPRPLALCLSDVVGLMPPEKGFTLWPAALLGRSSDKMISCPGAGDRLNVCCGT
jgi:hypothetical protein